MVIKNIYYRKILLLGTCYWIVQLTQTEKLYSQVVQGLLFLNSYLLETENVTGSHGCMYCFSFSFSLRTCLECKDCKQRPLIPFCFLFMCLSDYCNN